MGKGASMARDGTEELGPGMIITGLGVACDSLGINLKVMLSQEGYKAWNQCV